MTSASPVSSAAALTPASMASLISANLYDPRIVPTLEDYVLQQVRTSTYDFPPNRHLLSLYLSNPDVIRHDVLKHLLLLSLTSYPSSHFLSLSYLIPTPLQQQDPYKLLFRLHSHLSQGHFIRYWADKDRAGEGQGPSGPLYDDRVRRMVGGLVERLYTRVSVFILMDLWHLDRAHVEERVKAVGWRMEEDGKMVRVSGGAKGAQEAVPDAKRRQNAEVLSEDQLAKLLALVQV